MPRIILKTIINSSNIQMVFDLHRSIDLHKLSTIKTKEKAVAGKTSGLISLDETVTWSAKHFGITQELTTKITDFNAPVFFVDEMIKGAFKSFRHEHHFKIRENKVLVTDIFDYKAPFGVLGNIADVLFLKNYMKNFLKERNRIVKNFAETDKWKKVLEL